MTRKNEYEKIQEIVNTVDLGPNETRRMDCPSCGHHHSFSLTRTPDGIKWFCFHADCGFKGIVFTDPSKSEIVSLFGAQVEKEPIGFKIPESFVLCDFSPANRTLMTNYKIMDVHTGGRMDLRFDTKQGRHCFMVWHSGICYGAQGRGYNTTPKWLVYGNDKVPLIIPQYGSYGRPIHMAATPKRGCIVEDAISAAKVSNIMDGIGLGGTNFPEHYLPFVSDYKELYIALDKDATKKSMELQKYLNTYVRSIVVPLELDIKDMELDAIRSKFA